MGIIINKNIGVQDDDIDKIYITGDGFIRKEFKGISRESQLGYYETVWAASLNRDNTFAFNNIDDVDIGRVARVNVIFPIMKTQDFIDLQALLRQRHVEVNYFNVDLGRRVTEEMAITGNERKKLYTYGSNIVGMQNVTVNFVGTNRRFDAQGNLIKEEAVTITYNANGGSGSIEPLTTEYSNQIKIDSGNSLSNGTKHIKWWNTMADGSGKSYLPNLSLTVYENLTLYAIWE